MGRMILKHRQVEELDGIEVWRSSTTYTHSWDERQRKCLAEPFFARILNQMVILLDSHSSPHNVITHICISCQSAHLSASSEGTIEVEEDRVVATIPTCAP